MSVDADFGRNSVGDLPIAADEICHAPDAEAERPGGFVRSDDGLVWVGDQCEREVVLARELGVRRGVLGADADDGQAGVGEVVVDVAEGAGLGGADAAEVGGVEVEDDRAAGEEGGEVGGAAAGRVEREVGGLVADREQLPPEGRGGKSLAVAKTIQPARRRVVPGSWNSRSQARGSRSMVSRSRRAIGDGGVPRSQACTVRTETASSRAKTA